MGLDYTGRRLYISNVVLPGIYLDESCPNLSEIEFQECMFANLEVDHSLVTDRLPGFVRCYFSEVEGENGAELSGRSF